MEHYMAGAKARPRGIGKGYAGSYTGGNEKSVSGIKN
jgi:hypothetical protein